MLTSEDHLHGSFGHDIPGTERHRERHDAEDDRVVNEVGHDRGDDPVVEHQVEHHHADEPRVEVPDGSEVRMTVAERGGCVQDCSGHHPVVGLRELGLDDAERCPVGKRQ